MAEEEPPTAELPAEEISPFITGTGDFSGYQLVWRDEFSQDQVDTARWNIENTDGCPDLCGFGNNELQFYSSRENNVFTQNGKLVIKVQREPASQRPFLGGREYTSGKLTTKNKQSWKYGIFEVRAKLPTTKGHWPAVWMLPKNNTYGGWPFSGEMDIMEMKGSDDRLTFATLHYASAQTHSHHINGSTYRLPDSETSLSQQYYIFTMVWGPDVVTWHINRKQIYEVRSINSADSRRRRFARLAPFDKEFYMIINSAVGGNFDGNPTSDSVFPQRMYIDYVRVYQLQ